MLSSTWPAVVLAFLLAASVLAWWRSGGSFGSLSAKRRVNPEYFRGLNFLLNEETDKAIEVFIKAIEVDDETVELHLALGGLFRRNGQVDRATRIHQNLIARPTLTDDQRMQAVHELAQDYYKAGWLDRAEALFQELRESDDYRSLALNGLCQVYQQEKEWRAAIDVLRQHRRPERANYSKQIAHYYCELAEAALHGGDYDEAHAALQNAQSESQSVARVELLQGELSFARSDFNKAVEQWTALSASNPVLSDLVVVKMIHCYRSLADNKGLERYLVEVSVIPRDQDCFDVWLSALSETLGKERAIDHIFSQIEQHGLNAKVANYLLNSIESGILDDRSRAALLNDLLNTAKSHKIEYTCSGCGFDTRAMYWFCPNCGEWESFR